MDNRRETFVDKVDSQLKGLSEQSLHVFAIILRVAGVALFLESCSDGPFILSLIFLILTMSLADYLDKLRKRRRKTAKMKDYIDVEATPHVEPKPKIPTPPAIHPAYTRTLAELERSASQLERQFTQLDAFLDDFFQDSSISKDKYLSQIDAARKACRKNLEKATNAVNLFSDSNPPSPTRQEVLDGYVESSRRTVSDVNAIIDELLRVDQSNTKLTYEFLDENLGQLKNVTSHYDKARTR